VERDPAGKKVHVACDLLRNSAKEMPTSMVQWVLKKNIGTAPRGKPSP